MDKIEEAAKRCYLSGKIPVGEFPIVTEVAFIAGATSQEAKEYWQKGMYGEDNIKELCKILWDSNQDYLYQKYHSFENWFSQNKKK